MTEEKGYRVCRPDCLSFTYSTTSNGEAPFCKKYFVRVGLGNECKCYDDHFTPILTEEETVDHTAKHDEGKLQIHLVPPQIIRDIAEVRMYGNKKYKDPDNWKSVEKWRYVDALLRHLLLYLEDPDGVDEESGIKHYKHAACNMAFICAMEAKDE